MSECYFQAQAFFEEQYKVWKNPSASVYASFHLSGKSRIGQ